MSIDNYFVKRAGSWRHTVDPEVWRTDLWVDVQETLDSRFYFDGIDDTMEFCQDKPETISGMSSLMLAAMKNKPELFPELLRTKFLLVTEAS